MNEVASKCGSQAGRDRQFPHVHGYVAASHAETRLAVAGHRDPEKSAGLIVPPSKRIALVCGVYVSLGRLRFAEER